MPAPEFVLELRRHVGHAPLWLSGVTAIVLDDSRTRMICVHRSDEGRWTPITGIIDPLEEPAHAAEREVAEEAGVRARARRLIDVRSIGPITHANGDIASYLDLCFVLDHVDGDPHPADEECTEARWFPLDQLPRMSARFRDQIAQALRDQPEARFQR